MIVGDSKIGISHAFQKTMLIGRFDLRTLFVVRAPPSPPRAFCGGVNGRGEGARKVCSRDHSGATPPMASVKPVAPPNWLPLPNRAAAGKHVRRPLPYAAATPIPSSALCPRKSQSPAPVWLGSLTPPSAALRSARVSDPAVRLEPPFGAGL